MTYNEKIEALEKFTSIKIILFHFPVKMFRLELSNVFQKVLVQTHVVLLLPRVSPVGPEVGFPLLLLFMLIHVVLLPNW